VGTRDVYFDNPAGVLPPPSSTTPSSPVWRDFTHVFHLESGGALRNAVDGTETGDAATLTGPEIAPSALVGRGVRCTAGASGVLLHRGDLDVLLGPHTVSLHSRFSARTASLFDARRAGAPVESLRVTNGSVISARGDVGVAVSHIGQVNDGDAVLLAARQSPERALQSVVVKADDASPTRIGPSSARYTDATLTLPNELWLCSADAADVAEVVVDELRIAAGIRSSSSMLADVLAADPARSAAEPEACVAADLCPARP